MIDAAPFQVIGIVTHSSEATCFKYYSNSIRIVFEEKIRHIVRIEINATCIIAEGWFQPLIRSNFTSINSSTINSQTGDIEPSFANVLFQRKFLAQIAGSNGGMTIKHVIIEITTNPMGVPVVRRKKANLEVMDVALEM